MKKEDISLADYNKILENITPLLMQKGLKGTSMDSLASALQMSKRTLYEIFGSKENMFMEIHKYFHNKMTDALSLKFTTSANVVEAIIRCFLLLRDIMSNMSAEFIRDLEQMACNLSAPDSSIRKHHYQHLIDVLGKGVSQGYIREDINLVIQCRMLSIQMEALKRTEELFPEDISLLEVYDNIIIGFLRGISTQKGLEELERNLPNLSTAIYNSNE